MMQLSCANAVERVRRMRVEAGIMDEVIDIPTSFDGSWNQRGFRARDGVVAGVAEETGQVVDAIFMSNQCPQCTTLNSARENGTLEYLDYMKRLVQHEEECLLNHDGSSKVRIHVPG